MRAQRLGRVVDPGQFSFAQRGMNLLMADLMQEHRLATLAASAGWLTSSLLLNPLQQTVGLRTYFLFLTLVFAAVLFVARRLDGDYESALTASVERADVRVRVSIAEAVDALGGGHERRHLRRLLVSDEPALRLEAARGLSELDPASAEGPQAAFAPAPIDEVVATIAAKRPDVVFAPHVETSAGMMLPDDYIRAVADAVHAAGGSITVDSEIGRGSRFVVLLPLAR